MKDLISVIVPVYNVEAYLPQAVESILSQDYDKLEVILIDDGSRDASGTICDEFAARDSRVRVIHQKNGGAAAAKNAGLGLATGEYLSFVDSDDYLEPNVYGYLVDLLKAEKADMVQCAFRNVYRDRTEDFVLQPGRRVQSAGEYLKEYPWDWTCALLWNKLYRRELYEGIFFEEGHRIDDEFFTYQGILNAKKIIRDDGVIYNYRRRASSAMHSSQAREQLMLDRVDFMEKRRRVIADRFPALKREYDVNFLDALSYLHRDPDNSLKTMTLLQSALKQYIREKGHCLPPRNLWKNLWRLYWTAPEKLLETCDEREEDQQTDSYFA